MIQIDGVTLDLTKPETLKGVTLQPGGFIEQRKDGVTTVLQNQSDKPVPASDGPSN